MTDANAEIAECVAQYSAALGNDISPAMQSAVRRAAELVVLAVSLRSQALAGGSVSITELAQIESMADMAVSALRLPAATVRKVEPLVVKFVRAPDTPEGGYALQEARRRISELEAHLRTFTTSTTYSKAVDLALSTDEGRDE